MNEKDFEDLEKKGGVVRFKDKEQKKDRQGQIGGSFRDQGGKLIAVVLNRSKHGVGFGNNVPVEDLTDPKKENP